jgi:hypothetical protein
MGDGFDVNLGEMRGHCATVSTITSQVNSATGAASVGGDSYGAIGQFFASAIIAACGDAEDGILKAAKSFLDVHTGLTDVVNLYQQVDEAHAGLFRTTGTTEGTDRR